jgi:hypothetical protein
MPFEKDSVENCEKFIPNGRIFFSFGREVLSHLQTSWQDVFGTGIGLKKKVFWKPAPDHGKSGLFHCSLDGASGFLPPEGYGGTARLG